MNIYRCPQTIVHFRCVCAPHSACCRVYCQIRVMVPRVFIMPTQYHRGRHRADILQTLMASCFIYKANFMANKIIKGGYLSGYRTYIISGAGIISAIAAYLVGDSDIFTMLQAIFTLGGIYFLRRSNEHKGGNNGKDS